jgi:hypothetical protein
MNDTMKLCQAIKHNYEFLQVIKVFIVNNKLTIANIKHTLNIFSLTGNFKKTNVNWQLVKGFLNENC